MYIRLESIKNSSMVLVIDEIGVYKGEVDEEELFMECINIDLEPLIEDDYIYYLVDKNCLNKLLSL